MAQSKLVSREIEGRSDDELQNWLRDNRRTDGLPVILPTRERVEEMLFAAAIAGLDRDLILGRVAPQMGEATIEKVAINAVMAGCVPDYLPVVVAGVKAVCDERLDMSAVQSTTHALTPLLIVSGPIAPALAISGSHGALGYGHAANLTIGRAIRLCLINLGGGWPGFTDMTLLGHPGKLSYCLAEHEESPYPRLHETFGFDAEQSVLTAVNVLGPHTLTCVLDDDDPDQHNRLLELIARTITSPGNNNAVAGRGTVVVCLNLEHARALHAAGYTRADIQRELYDRATNPYELARLNGDIPLADEAPVDAHGNRRALESPEAVLVLVAGGPGAYSCVMMSWGYGAHGNVPVSKEIVTTDECDIALPVSIAR
ncbi:hypothetical protein [Gordonia terrae]|uniref:Thioredoxin n=2 Tax=Gordonia terrae TaxID=2055 RepID=A0AAD0K3X1_9ACTN|nr:hypothetical protein [Gordonia terrae]VTR09162.1 Uncharacterised protein [Clostridioides difficile]ANY21844.1 hypothetical protein BCM27_02600 [Gordonia terrae]AWO82578.1 hypothetical protein DLJ61_02615 [Gordonia terrae]VTS22158.1 Uncharacterised protein [Gordonia terrae]GAB44655.1 hypothetical protein GOTRE_070_00080 [Gordonia terrae NBRC 100016]